ncbi:MAG TPA: hypothetical protein VGK48_01600 [Terriglobia bacterium]
MFLHALYLVGLIGELLFKTVDAVVQAGSRRVGVVSESQNKKEG